jgi:hypothetical protein
MLLRFAAAVLPLIPALLAFASGLHGRRRGARDRAQDRGTDPAHGAAEGSLVPEAAQRGAHDEGGRCVVDPGGVEIYLGRSLRAAVKTRVILTKS